MCTQRTGDCFDRSEENRQAFSVSAYAKMLDDTLAQLLTPRLASGGRARSIFHPLSRPLPLIKHSLLPDPIEQVMELRNVIVLQCAGSPMLAPFKYPYWSPGRNFFPSYLAHLRHLFRLPDFTFYRVPSWTDDPRQNIER